MMERKLEIHKDKSFRDAVKKAQKVRASRSVRSWHNCTMILILQLLDLERYVPLERCRLVKYDDYSETLDQSFEGQEVMGGEGAVLASYTGSMWEERV